jgi:hypothetical protein
MHRDLLPATGAAEPNGDRDRQRNRRDRQQRERAPPTVMGRHAPASPTATEARRRASSRRIA